MRILVVEDEHKIALSIQKGLEQERYAVDVAYDGSSGFDLASTEEYDLLIIDRMLPKMDGTTMTKELRKNGVHTPILLLTAKGQVEDKVEGLDSGADDYVTKPFAFSELLARIRALIRRPKRADSSILTIRDLKLNTVNFEVKRGNTVVRLSGKEYAMLEYLMRHPNTILKKEQILQHVWDYDTDVLPNTVEVYVKHLRDKIDHPFSGPKFIHTIRGFGYKIS